MKNNSLPTKKTIESIMQNTTTKPDLDLEQIRKQIEASDIDKDAIMTLANPPTTPTLNNNQPSPATIDSYLKVRTALSRFLESCARHGFGTDIVDIVLLVVKDEKLRQQFIEQKLLDDMICCCDKMVKPKIAAATKRRVDKLCKEILHLYVMSWKV